MLMPIEPLVLLGGTEVTGIAGLAGLLTVSAHGLVYKVLSDASKERSEERRVREKESEATRVSAAALQESIAAMRQILMNRERVA